MEDGFLTREKSGRAYRLNLSEKGQDAFGLSHQVFYDWDQERLSALEPAERERLIALLAKVKRKDKER